MKQALYVWVGLMSLITFITFGADKRRAVRHQYRISEKALLVISVIGGGVGGWLGMKMFHHKTYTEFYPHYHHKCYKFQSLDKSDILYLCKYANTNYWLCIYFHEYNSSHLKYKNVPYLDMYR